DGLGNGAADERLRRGHHFQMRKIMNAPFATMRLEGAVEHRQVLRLDAAANDFAIFFGVFIDYQYRRRLRIIFADVFNRVEFLDVRDDGRDFRLAVAEPAQRIGHTTVEDFQHAAAGEQFVFDERDVGFDARRVAVHRKRNSARWGEHGDLGVPVAGFPAGFQRAVPAMARLVLQIIEFPAGLDLFNGVAVQLDDAQHGFDVVLLARLGHMRTTGVAVAGERADTRGKLGALLVSVAGHNRRNGAGQRAA